MTDIQVGNPHLYPDVTTVVIEDSSTVAMVTLEVAGIETNLGLVQSIAQVDVIFPGLAGTGVATAPASPSTDGIVEFVGVDGTVLFTGKIED